MIVAAIPVDHAEWNRIAEEVDLAAAAVRTGRPEDAFGIYCAMVRRLAAEWLELMHRSEGEPALSAFGLHCLPKFGMMVRSDGEWAMVEKSVRITVRFEPELLAEIEDLLRIEREDGRDTSVAAFIRMAVRRLVRDERQRLKTEAEIMTDRPTARMVFAAAATSLLATGGAEANQLLNEQWLEGGLGRPGERRDRRRRRRQRRQRGAGLHAR